MINPSFNPWNHRADISAQAYLKPYQKGQKKCHRIVSPECIMKNFAVIPKKILIFLLDIWFEYYGELIFRDFSPKFYFRKNYFETRHQIQM
jgi:hypothetical protein